MGNTNELSKWIIYMYTFPNGKKYIGKTSKTLKERQGVGFCNYDKNTILGKAIDKYKIENIKQDILFESEMTDEYSSRLEMICIALFKTNCLRYANPSYGYNMTDGGEGRVGVPGMSGTANPNCGKTGVLSVRSIGCYCVEDNKYFESLNLAAQYYKTSTSHLSKCCKNPFLHTINNKHFLYTQDVSEENIQKCLLHKREKRVYCIENKKYFDNAKIAASYAGVDVRNIRHSCHNLGKRQAGIDPVTKQGLHWLYESDVINYNAIHVT